MEKGDTLVYICSLVDDKYMTTSTQSQSYFYMISKEEIKILREKLPRGFGNVIKERLEKRNIFYSRSMIEQVLNSENLRYEIEIIDEASRYVKELEEREIAIQERIL